MRYCIVPVLRAGLTKAQVEEGLALSFMCGGTRAIVTIGRALKDFRWPEKAEGALDWPEGWVADPAAFASGVDFSTMEVLPGEVDKIVGWYERTIDWVPVWVRFLARYNPAALKGWRYRYEKALVTLPKQILPLSFRGSGRLSDPASPVAPASTAAPASPAAPRAGASCWASGAGLTGRLGTYMGEYTAPAIAGSLEIWKEVARTPDWLGDPQQAGQALYSQIRRWYELIILGQDPTTLIRPAAGLKNFKTLKRALRLFGPEVAATVVGLGFLVVLLFLINVGSAAAWAKTLSGILAVVGLTLAGLAATIKNSAQALLKRLRQDTYTDLVATAVQTAPPPPGKSDIENAIGRRRLTSATPNYPDPFRAAR